MQTLRPNRSTTSRGFTTYDEFEDTRGRWVTVRQSSVVRSGAAAGPFVYVWAAVPSRQHPGTDEPTVMHLTRDQAARLRDALDTFIREAGG